MSNLRSARGLLQTTAFLLRLNEVAGGLFTVPAGGGITTFPPSGGLAIRSPLRKLRILL
jgi:hypothetical protein